MHAVCKVEWTEPSDNILLIRRSTNRTGRQDPVIQRAHRCLQHVTRLQARLQTGVRGRREGALGDTRA